jgi:hypothetical protein
MVWAPRADVDATRGRKRLARTRTKVCLTSTSLSLRCFGIRFEVEEGAAAAEAAIEGLFVIGAT